MSGDFYGVANGREVGVYDNWEDCKKQVNGYSNNKYKKFGTPDQAFDFIDQNSSRGKLEQSYNTDRKAIGYRNNDQVALRDNRWGGEASNYQRTDYVVWNKKCLGKCQSKEETAPSYMTVLTRVVEMEMDISSRNVHALTGKTINEIPEENLHFSIYLKSLPYKTTA